ncbi:hypothetical protein [Roseomonas fluvialis]|uniref:hypothetical protein n=1 Tax=Roseomonas fluvialis TaxID=1750527 RepID=UPI001FCD8E50|nr:hypothetical protein [Roseomonas fluvialis]
MSLAAMAGCTGAADRVVPEPTDIRLEGAMVSVVRAFRAAQEVSAATGQPIGLYPCTVTVTFNITAGGTDRREIVLDANVTPPARIVQGALGLTATTEQTQTASRGNQIAILLTSAACNPPETLGTLRPQNVAVGSGGPPIILGGARISGGLTREQREVLDALVRERRR